MTVAEDVLRLARDQLGVCENPMGSNNVIYNTWFYSRPVHGAAYPWCAVFVSWLFHKLNAKNLIHVYSAYSGDILHAMQRAGEEVSILDAKPGDIITYDYGDGGITDHIGIVEMRIGSRSFWTIEGNTGDAVRRHERTQGSGLTMWFTRPKYAQPTPREEEETMLYEGVGKEFVFGDCYVDKRRYWMHTLGDTKDVRFELLSHRTKETKVTDGQTVTGHQDHDMDVVAATLGIKGSYTLTCKSAKSIRWSLREVPR